MPVPKPTSQAMSTLPAFWSMRYLRGVRTALAAAALSFLGCQGQAEIVSWRARLLAPIDANAVSAGVSAELVGGPREHGGFDGFRHSVYSLKVRVRPVSVVTYQLQWPGKGESVFDGWTRIKPRLTSARSVLVLRM